jgi:ribosome-binding protein aMBF1 (putative translation factor)
MKTAFDEYTNISSLVPEEIKREVTTEMAISNRLDELMTQRGITKTGLAKALNKRPCEVTKWLSGQHNFTIRTLSMLSAYFGVELIAVR